MLLGLPFTLCTSIYMISCTRNSALMSFFFSPRQCNSISQEGSVPFPVPKLLLVCTTILWLGSNFTWWWQPGHLPALHPAFYLGCFSSECCLGQVWVCQDVSTLRAMRKRRKDEMEALLSRNVQAAAVIQLFEQWTTLEMLGSEAMLNNWSIPLLWLSHSPSPIVNRVLASDTLPDFLDLIRK